MCPPGPVTLTVSLSQAAVIGPVLVPILPTSSRGSQCSAKMRSTEAMPPAAITSMAPPGTSSAGWKISRTLPGSARAAAARARNSPVPSRMAVCTSCPQAWHASGIGDRYGTSFSSLIGSASMSARSATTWLVGRAVPDVDDQAGALRQDGRPQAGRLEPERDAAGGPVLVVAGLGVSVQVPPELDEFRLVPGEERVEFTLEVMLGHVAASPLRLTSSALRAAVLRRLVSALSGLSI